MVNFLNCTNMYLGVKGMRVITYQQSQPNITVYYRKYQHNFVENIDTESKEGVDCQSLPKFNAFLVSDDNYVELFCGGCFGKANKLMLPLKDKSKDNKMEVLTIKVSRD